MGSGRAEDRPRAGETGRLAKETSDKRGSDTRGPGKRSPSDSQGGGELERLAGDARALGGTVHARVDL